MLEIPISLFTVAYFVRNGKGIKTNNIYNV